MEQSIAIRILRQLGGLNFINNTGCSGFVYKPTENWLQMKLPANKSGYNRVRISLEADNTYTYCFFHAETEASCTLRAITAGELKSIFTQLTGLPCEK